MGNEVIEFTNQDLLDEAIELVTVLLSYDYLSRNEDLRRVASILDKLDGKV